MSGKDDIPLFDPVTGEIIETIAASPAPASASPMVGTTSPAPARAAPGPGNVVEYSVSEISGAIKRTMEDTFGHVRVRGEVGRVSRPASGHIYLDLKDERAVLAAVIWKGTAARLKMLPEQGLEVVATGRITTYAGQSKYQLVIERLEPAGIGALMALLEERRRKLAAEGLFDEARKKPLPWLPRVIGVITSPTGAVIRDILHRLADRFPRHVLVWPVRVQGETCAAEVARAIAGFNALPADGSGPVPRPDVLIVARGGGSLEDLWGFNEEIVARAAAASTIPLISAVGHETDTTLIDHAADKRAPTPTAAAEMAVPVRAELLAWLHELAARLTRSMANLQQHRGQRLLAAARALPKPEDILALARQRLDHAAHRLNAALLRLAGEKRTRLASATTGLSPHLLRRHASAERQHLDALARRLPHVARQATHPPRQRLEQALQRLQTALLHLTQGKRTLLARAAAGLSPHLPRRQALTERQRIDDLARRLIRAGGLVMQPRRQRLEQTTRLLDNLNYRAVLARGYVLAHDAASGALITRAEQVRGGQRLTLEFFDGQRHARIEDSSHADKPRGKAGNSSGGQGQDSLF